MFITLLTHKHTLSYTQQWDPGVEDINTLETESVLSPEANCVSLQSFTTVTPGYPNVSFICTAQWREVCIRAFCWGRLSFFTIQHCDTGWYTHGNGRKVWLFTATKLDLHIAPLEGVINLLEWSVVNPICGLKRQQESDLTSTTTEVRSVRMFFWGVWESVAMSAGQNSPRAEKEREKWATNVWWERRHNSSHHGDPERGQSSPHLVFEPKPLLVHPPLKSPGLLPTALDGHTWITLALPERHKQMKEWLRKKPVFSPGLSADHFGLLSPQILRRSSFGGSAQFSFSFSEPPIIPSVMISPPLRHPVSACLEKWELSLIEGCLLKEQMIHHILGRSLWKERS